MNPSSAIPIRLLLIKSGSGSGTSVAHKGGYAMYGTPPRWHKITAEKPAPKVAPVAAHPKSAGHHAPVDHFTDAQWSALKLPDANVNAPVFNKALDKLKGWADAGEVTAILGASFGSNTYGQKLAKIANTLLGMHGSPHQVTSGQKPGTHPAVQNEAPTDPHPSGLPEHLAPKAESTPVADAAPAGFKVGQKVTIDPDLQHMDAGKTGEVIEVKNYGDGNHYIVKIDGGDKEPFQGGELSRAASPVEQTPAVAPAAPIEIKHKADGTPLKPTVPAFTSTLADIENWIADGNKLQLQDAVLNLAGLQSVSAKAAHAFANAGVRFLDKKDEAASAAAQAQPAKGSFHKLASKDWLAAEKLSKPAAGGGLAEKPAFDHIAQSVASKKTHSLPSQKTFHKLAAQDWMAANPDKGAEMYEALAAHKLSHLAAAVGPGVHPAAEPAPADPMSAWVDFNKKHWGAVTEPDDVTPFLGTKDAGPAALAAFGSGSFVDLNANPDLPASKALLSYVGQLPQFDSGSKLHRVMGFDTPDAVDGYLKQLQPAKDAAGSQVKTVSSWTTSDPAAPGQTPMNNIALDLAEQFGEHKVFLTLQPGHQSAKDVSFLYSKDGTAKAGGEILLPFKTKLDVVSIKKDGLKTHVVVREVHEGDTKPAADGGTLVLTDGKWVKQGGNAPAPEPVASPAAAPTSKLDAIPWDNLMLPAANSNAPGHNKAIAKIKAMAYAGDAAGLGLIVASKSAAKQTYAKKQGLIAQTALAALSEGAPPAASAPAAPVPEPAPAPLVGGLNPDTKAMIDDFASVGEWKKVAKVAKNSSNPGAQAYAEKLIKEKPAAKPEPAPVPAAAVPPMESSTPAGGKVYVDAPLYENTIDGHYKFWSVSTYGSVMTTKHGKIGTKGNETVKTFSSPEAAKAEAVKLMGQKKAKGYQYSGFAEHTYGVDTGPKEGDTKAGAGGTLVFKDGHWVLQDDGSGWSYSASNPGLSGCPAIEFEKDGVGYYIAKDPGEGTFQFGSTADDSPEPDTIDAADLPSLIGQMKDFGHPIPDLAALKKLDAGYKPALAKPAAVKKLSMIDISTAIQTVTPNQSKFATNNAAKLAASSAKAGDAEGIKKAHKLALDVGYNKTAKHIAAVAKAMGVIIPGTSDSSGAPAAPQPAPVSAPVSIDGVMVMDGWAQTGGQGGSNPGGKFKDQSGQEWYCKFPNDADTAKSEILAAKLYALAGLSSQDAVLVSKNGKVGLASKWVDIKKASSASALAKVDGALSGFVVDAWLGNWDVVGMANDNLQIGPDGKAHRVDAGGSLEYRAQGEKKPFGPKVDELTTLLDAGLNPNSAAVFKAMKKADMVASAAKVLAISDVTIRAMVNQHGPGDAAAKEKLIATLIARKKDIAAKFPAAVKKKKEVKFDAEKISAPPSFLNWGGSGKSGPSSKEFLNQANEDAVQAIFATAKLGSLKQVEGLTAKVYNKETGQVTGEAPVLSHPSQHVKGYAQQAVNEINYQLNPPKVFRFDGGHPLHSLNSAYPAFTGPASSSVAQKLGKFIVLGEPGKIGLQDVGLPAKLTHTEAGGTMSTMTFAKQAQASMAQMPATQKQAIKSYTGSSYHAMNGSLWSGNPSGAAKAAGEALKTLGHEITPGTVLSRKISLHGGDLQSLLGATGKILQEPAIMSTSIRPSSWSGNVHLKLHIGPGVKGLWVGHNSLPGGGALSSHSGEDEMILPPGTRLMIVSVKSGSDSDGFGKSSAHVVEAIVLPTQ